MSQTFVPNRRSQRAREGRMTVTIGRRELLAALGGAATAWPLAARAQQAERMRKVGLLMGAESDPDSRARVKALRQRLGELGWSENRNTRIDVVWGVDRRQTVARRERDDQRR